ncbi:MAG: hypothetical protein ACRCXX_04180 [Cetobacterium sp.]|uniref:hypothetical protein n=1 Tax=Cetobacterium sp. TaxID=2071632 RepID=UPI003F3943A3
MKKELWRSRDLVLESRGDDMYTLYNVSDIKSGLIIRRDLLPGLAMALKGQTIVINTDDMSVNFHSIMRGLTLSVFDSKIERGTTMYIGRSKDTQGLLETIVKASKNTIVPLHYWHLGVHENWEYLKSEILSQ